MSSKIKSMGLNVTPSLSTLLEACKSNEEVDATIRQIQNNIREGITNSCNLSEIVVPNDKPIDPVQTDIDRKVGSVMKAFGA